MAEKSSFVERITCIVATIDERLHREKKAEELNEMIEKLSEVNGELENTKWANKFASGLIDTEVIAKEYKIVKESYEELKGVFKRLNWAQSKEIDILEPSAFIEPMDSIIEATRKFDRKLGDAIRELKKRISANRETAESLSIIPEIKIDTHVFDKALVFLNRLGENTRDIANFTGKSNKSIYDKTEEWKELNKQMSIEQKKLDLESLKKRMKLSQGTVEFLENLVRNEGEVDFETLSGVIIEEVKEKFPDLSKKLCITLAEVDKHRI